MLSIFQSLSHAVEGSPASALGAALAWGILSILLSPCHLMSIPLIVGFMAGQSSATPRNAFWTSFLFALGMLVTIGVLGAATAAAGRMAGDLGGGVNYGVACVLFVVGLHLLGVIQVDLARVPGVNPQRRGRVAAFVLGLVFGIALGPCTFAFMAPVLAVAFKVAARAPALASGLLMAYGIGHCGVIVAAGTSAGSVQAYLRWSDGSRALAVLKKSCGLLVLMGGLYLIYTAP